MKIGRNQLCPCGSGLKYKKCCLNKPKEDSKILDVDDIKYMENRVITLLAGKAAIDIVYKTCDVGANSDVSRAYDIVSRFVANYCMFGFNSWIRYSMEQSEKVKESKDNEVNMVRNLNLDEEKNLCESLLYKGTVEKNMLNEEKMLSGTENSKGISLPKIKTITVTNILESEKKLNENKKISLRNLANNQLEKELYGNMENIKKKLKELKDKKYLLYRDYETKTKQIKDLNLEIEAFQTGQGESFLSKIFGLRISAPNINSETEKNTSKNLLETPMRLRKKSEQRSPEKKLASKTKSLIKNLWGQSKYEEKIQRIKMAYLAKKENDDKKMEKYRKIKQLKEDLKQIDTELTDINGQLTDLKTQDKEIGRASCRERV